MTLTSGRPSLSVKRLGTVSFIAISILIWLRRLLSTFSATVWCFRPFRPCRRGDRSINFCRTAFRSARIAIFRICSRECIGWKKQAASSPTFFELRQFEFETLLLVRQSCFKNYAPQASRSYNFERKNRCIAQCKRIVECKGIGTQCGSSAFHSEQGSQRLG